LSLARTLTAGGKAAEALAVIASLRRRPRSSSQPASPDPRLDLAEAAAQDSLGQVQPAQGARLEAARLFHDLGDTNAESGALIGIANAEGDRGDYDGAIAGYRQVLASFERTGNRKGAARIWSDVANTSWMQGNVEESLRSAERELALSREINDRRGTVWGLGVEGLAADPGNKGRRASEGPPGSPVSARVRDLPG
jgi:tetratricopeptide (TPR) repeat protein